MNNTIFHEIMLIVLQAVIAVAVPVIAGYLIRFLNAMAKRLALQTHDAQTKAYIDEAAHAAESAVASVSHVYVDALKESGTFTRENQTEAIAQAVARAKMLLTQDAADFIASEFGDLDKYLETKVGHAADTRNRIRPAS
jgi:hypothetical protein